MIYLLLRIALSVAFSQTVRWVQVRGGRTLPPLLVNYLVAAVVCAGIAWGLGGRHFAFSTFWLAAVGGVTYVTSLVLMLRAMRESGVAITGAVLQLALMLPVTLAIWRYHEAPTPLRIAGILLACISLPLMSAGPAGRRATGPPRLSLTLLVLFFSSGISQSAMKELENHRPPMPERLAFMALLFLIATVSTAVWMGLARELPPAGEAAMSGSGRRVDAVADWSIGIGLGLVNAGQLIGLLLALQQLPALVVFPVSSALGLVTNALVSMALWKEHPSRAALIGMGMATVAVVLLNL